MGPEEDFLGDGAMSDNDNDKGGGFRNVVIGVLAGAVGIIAIKLLIKWINGEI
jgi:hypothetical protein